MKKILNILIQFSIILACLSLGQLIVSFTGIRFPASIIGMILLTVFLELGWVKLEWVEDVSSFLIRNLSFFLVPPAVAIMLYFNLIKANLCAIVVATVLSTVIVLLVTAWTYQLFRKRKK